MGGALQWFCSGQSNMWLPMNMDTSRNVTYDAVLRGKYKNIRMFSMPHNNQPDVRLPWSGYCQPAHGGAVACALTD